MNILKEFIIFIFKFMNFFIHEEFVSMINIEINFIQFFLYL
jgi:hypothetical protein